MGAGWSSAVSVEPPEMALVEDDAIGRRLATLSFVGTLADWRRPWKVVSGSINVRTTREHAEQLAKLYLATARKPIVLSLSFATVKPTSRLLPTPDAEADSAFLAEVFGWMDTMQDLAIA